MTKIHIDYSSIFTLTIHILTLNHPGVCFPTHPSLSIRSLYFPFPISSFPHSLLPSAPAMFSHYDLPTQSSADGMHGCMPLLSDTYQILSRELPNELPSSRDNKFLELELEARHILSYYFLCVRALCS